MMWERFRQGLAFLYMRLNPFIWIRIWVQNTFVSKKSYEWDMRLAYDYTWRNNSEIEALCKHLGVKIESITHPPTPAAACPAWVEYVVLPKLTVKEDAETPKVAIKPARRKTAKSKKKTAK